MDVSSSEKRSWKLVIRTDNEARLQALFVFYWIYNSIITSGINFATGFLGFSEYADVIRGIFVAIMLLYASPAIMNCIRFRHIVLYVAVMLVYVLNFVFFPENTQWLQKNIFEFAFFILPFFFLGVMLNKMRIPYKALVISSRIIIVLMLVVFLFYSVLKSDYEMGRAYVVLPSVMLVTHSMMEKWNIWDICITIAGGIFLLMCATRGPILLFLVFVLLQLFLMSEKHKKLYIFLLGLAIVLWISPLGIQLVENAMERFSAGGFNVRVFEYLLSGDILDDNGRDYLTERVFEMISQRPLIGNGLYSDRLATSSLSWAREGTYVHNIIYEFWCDFGYAVGSVFLIILVWMIVKTYRNISGYSDFKALLLVLVISHVGKLLVSSSFLDEPGFWLCFGICYESFGRKHIFRRRYVCKRKKDYSL